MKTPHAEGTFEKPVRVTISAIPDNYSHVEGTTSWAIPGIYWPVKKRKYQKIMGQTFVLNVNARPPLDLFIQLTVLRPLKKSVLIVDPNEYVGLRTISRYKLRRYYLPK